MLMPAAVLVLLMLGGIAFDYAHLYLGKRELTSLAEAAANDAVTYGVDAAAVRRGDGYVLDPDLVTRSVDASVATHARDLHLIGEPEVELVSPTTVEVRLTARVDYVFTRAIPGVRQSETVRVVARADARNS
jgi:Flp pilus assembly protein TadG